MTLREAILSILEPGEWMTVRAIYRAHGKGARASTRNMLAALERAGLVVRDPHEGAATLWRKRLGRAPAQGSREVASMD